MSNLGHTARSPWAATPLIAIAAFAGVWGLSTMIEMGGWLRTVAGILLVTTLAVIGTRMLSRSRLLPTAIGGATAILLMLPVFARDAEDGRHYLPTPTAFTNLADAVNAGAIHAATSTAPVAATRPFIALIAASLLGLFLLAEHIAVSWRAVAVSGLLLIAPWVPAVLFLHRVPTIALVVALAAWITAMALTRRASASERVPSVGTALTATTAVVAAALLVVPTALGGAGWGILPRFEQADAFDTATRLNLALDLRNSLVNNSSSPVLRYTTTGGRPDTLRLYTLTDFDGTAWSRQDPDLGTRSATSGLLWPLPVDGWSERSRDRINVDVLSLAERNLPVTGAPRTIEAPSGWFYNAELDEIVTEGPGTQGVSYSMVTDLEYHDARALVGTQPAIDAGQGDVTDPQYLNIAASIDLQRIEALALEVTEGADSRYAASLMLQQYFRDTTQFRYDTTVSPRGVDSVSTFLDERAGYCVQFATAMVMMARSLDIPARMSVGFLAGRPGDDGSYIVRGGQAHAWPEIYFPDHGWVRFEPTPSIQTGGPPQWADPSAGQVPVPREILDGGQVAPPPAPPIEQPGPVDPVETDPAPAVPVWVYIVAATALAITVAAVVWWRRRRAITAHALEGPEGAWLALRERLGYEFEWPATYTPHEVSAFVQARMRRIGDDFSAAARTSLVNLSNAVSDHRYGPHGTPMTHDEMMVWVDAVALEVEAAIERDATDRPVRDGARSAPRRGA